MSDQKPLPFVYQFLSGAVAGLSEILVMYPLDVVKTRMQLSTAKTDTMFSVFSSIVKNEGPARLYRGISAPIMMEAPKRAIKFSANDSWGSFYRNLFGVKQQTQPLAVLTGATAGATEAFVVVPFELVKIRMQDRNSAFKGPLDVVMKTIQREGIFGVYNGLEATLWRHIAWNGGYFGIIFQIKSALPTAKTDSQKTRNDLIAGTLGGTFGTAINTPFDVVKSRIQSEVRIPGVAQKYNWTLPAVHTVFKEEGFAALYKGFIPKVLRLGPGGGILLVVYTNMIEFFRKYAEPR